VLIADSRKRRAMLLANKSGWECQARWPAFNNLGLFSPGIAVPEYLAATQPKDINSPVSRRGRPEFC
jgi:hypothetical protein